MIPTVTLVVKGQDIYTAPVIQGGFSDLLQLTQPRKPITTDWAEEPGLDTVQTMLQPQPTRPLKTKLWLPKGLYQSDIRYIDTIRVGYDRLYPIKIRGTYVVDSYNDESVYAISGTIQQSKTPPTTLLGRNLLKSLRGSSGSVTDIREINVDGDALLWKQLSKDTQPCMLYLHTELTDGAYTLSYKCSVGENYRDKIYYNRADNGAGYDSRIATTTTTTTTKLRDGVWLHTVTFDSLVASKYRSFYFYGTDPFDPAKEVRFWDMKLERGTVATDWTPAPEDVAESVSTLESHKQTTAPKEYTLGPEHIALATFGASPLEGWQSALQDKTTYKETSLEASRDVVLPILLQGDTFAQLLTARDTLDALLYRRTRNQLTTPYGTYSFFFSRSRAREYNITDKPYIIYDLTLTLV